MLIQEVRARVCYNGRGDPGIEADVTVAGRVGRALSPSGASRGTYEAVPFVDNDPEKTVTALRAYAPKVIGKDAADIRGLAAALRSVDGTANYSRIGGAAAYAVSIAAAKAEAAARDLPLYRVISSGPHALPFPLGNIVGGGKHASDLSPSIQEVLVSPLGASTATEAVRLNFEVSRLVGKKLAGTLPYPVGRGDEGGWSPGLDDEQAIQVVKDAADEVGDRAGARIRVGVDFASGSLFDSRSGNYHYRASGKRLDREGQMAYVAELRDRYDLFYLEDPLHEDDFEGFASLRASLGKALLVGDDLYVTNKERLFRGAQKGSTNAVIVKVNQVGSLGDADEFSEAARAAGNLLAASHRSGDNEGSELAHVAVGFGCALIKCGVVGGERTAKLNELIRLSEGGIGRFQALPL